MSKVKVFVLLGGQEVICSLAADQQLIDPMNIVSQSLPNGQSNVQFSPCGIFSFGLNPIKDFNYDLVLFSYEPTQQVAEKYIEVAQQIKAKVSGLIIPNINIAGHQNLRGTSVDRR